MAEAQPTWGNDPIQKADSPGGGGWGKDPLKVGNPATGGKTPAQEFAEKRAIEPGGVGIENALSFGFGDEIFAGMTAADAGIANMFKKLKGEKTDFTAGEVYDAALAENRKDKEKFQKAHPGGSYEGLEFLTGLMSPAAKVGGGWITEAPGILGKFARGAGVGTLVGGLEGFGSGEGGFGNRAASAGSGAVVGGAVGGAFPVVGSTGSAVAGYMGRAAKAFRSAIQDLTGKTVEEAAATLSPSQLEKVKNKAIELVHETLRSGGKEAKDLTEDEAFKAGKPVTAAEAGGNTTTSMLASINRRSGTTADEAEAFFRRRGMERGERLQSDLAQASGLKPEHVQGNMDDMIDEFEKANPALYKQAFSKGAVDVSKDRELRHLFSQPNMQQALSWARRISENRGLRWTYSRGYPKLTWQQLDLVKRGLQTHINRTNKDSLGRMITDDATRADLNTAKKFREHLFKLNSDYKTAVSHAGDSLELKGTYDKAPKFMSLKATARQFDAWLNDLNPANLRAAKAGWVNDVYQRLRKDQLRPKDLQSTEFLEKAQRLLGAEQAKKFVADVGQEMRLKGGENIIPPKAGSRTASNLHAAEETDQKTDQMVEDLFHSMNRRGVKFALTRAAINAVYNVFQATKTPEREALRNEVGKLLMLRPDELRLKLEGHGKVEGGIKQKAKEIAKMVTHLGSSAAIPAEQLAVQEGVSNE